VNPEEQEEEGIELPDWVERGEEVLREGGWVLEEPQRAVIRDQKGARGGEG
jgi:hypothetical protein